MKTRSSTDGDRTHVDFRCAYCKRDKFGIIDRRRHILSVKYRERIMVIWGGTSTVTCRYCHLPTRLKFDGGTVVISAGWNGMGPEPSPISTSYIPLFPSGRPSGTRL